MTSFSETTRNTVTDTNESKNATSFTQYLRHGKEPTMGDLADYTFQSVIFDDGTTMENVTFAELQNIVWSLVDKS